MRVAACALALLAGISTSAVVSAADGRGAYTPSKILPRPEPAFDGKIGQVATESSPSPLISQVRAPDGAPNILLILTDDVGFGASSTFGGAVPTPTFDRLAEQGARYNSFHTTALCSPTRASLLTGRNPHKVGFGTLATGARGYPGYSSILPKSAATIGEVLRQNGYATSWFGKSHNTPEWEQSAAGPFDRWPDGLGFDYFYGFHGAATDQWDPELYENRLPVQKPANDLGYILDRDLGDHAVEWLRSIDAAEHDKPIFMYFAPGTAHAPQHAPEEWIAKFRGQFDEGWDKLREATHARQLRLGLIPKGTKLSPAPEGLPAWSSLSNDEKRLYARMMEVFAGGLAYADHQVGRIIEELRSQGRLENTLVIYIQGDNGGQMAGVAGLGFDADEPLAEKLKEMHNLGGPKYNNMYPSGWAWATNAPFQLSKGNAAYLGGTRNGMVISWPGHLNNTRVVRQQFHHVADIAPTIYEAAGIEIPIRVNGVDQMPLDGVSMVYSFFAPKAASHRTKQIFEMSGTAAYYADGWMASSAPVRRSSGQAGGPGLSALGRWELFDLTKDYSQSTDVSASHPEKLEELKRRFWTEAATEQILPLQDSPRGAGALPALNESRTHFSFKPSRRRIAGSAFPNLQGKNWRLSAEVQLTSIPADGTIIAYGGRRIVAWALTTKAGVPEFTFRSGGYLAQFRGNAPLGSGRHMIDVAFTKADGGKTGQFDLRVDGTPIGTLAVDRVPVSPFASKAAAIGWGWEALEAANSPPRAFSGTVDQVTVDIDQHTVGATPPVARP
jgi:arylsulfatase